MTGTKPARGRDSSRFCGGDKRQSEGTCTRPAGWGTSHPGTGRCKLHGGSTPSHVISAQGAEARRAVATFGLPREVDPHTALLEELHRTAGVVTWLGAVVADLDKDDVVWGKTRSKVGGDDAGVTHEAGVNVWVKLWNEQRRHLVDVAKACVSAGIEERRIQLAESQGQQLAAVVRAVLERLDLDDRQRQLVTVVVPEEFRRIAIGAGGDLS